MLLIIIIVSPFGTRDSFYTQITYLCLQMFRLSIHSKDFFDIPNFFLNSYDLFPFYVSFVFYRNYGINKFQCGSFHYYMQQYQSQYYTEINIAQKKYFFLTVRKVLHNSINIFREYCVLWTTFESFNFSLMKIRSYLSTNNF